MKKITMLCLAGMLSLCGAMPVQAQADSPATASKDVFDFTPFQDKVMLDLFVHAIEQGRKYPTAAEWEAAGFNIDLEFSRSHVRPRSVMIEKSKQLNPSLYENRKLWMNLPTGIGSMVGGYPSNMFSNDVFSMWNYTNLFGSWNHSLFQAPGAWVDAAHKNGTDIFSGIKFFESWTAGSGDGEYSQLITMKNQDGSFKYSRALIYCLMFMGQDGINYNWEDNSFSDADIVAFHKDLYRIAKEEGFDNFHIGIYTSNQSLSSRNVDALYGGEDGKTADTMLNYSGGDFATYNLSGTQTIAKNALGTADDVYSGVWIVSMDRNWTGVAGYETGLCLWGEHGQSRFMSYNVGDNQMEFQSNYQKLLERAFSGGNRNPANLPTMRNSGNNWELDGEKEPLSTFGGIATYIPERTAIQGQLPFSTNFNLGNGDRFNFKGKKTFADWYNMGAQDVVPTYRWLVYNAGTTTVSTDIQPEFTHEDSYMGGSSLKLSGKVTSAGTDVVLYRTKLEISSTNPKAKIALKPADIKTSAAMPSNLCLILKKTNSDQWQEFVLGDIKASEWDEKETNLSGFNTGDYIEYIGLRVKGAASDNYAMLVGKLEISDDRYAKPADIKAGSLKAEVKEETTNSLSVKLNWAVDPISTATRGDWNMVYNDEANVDHFEVMYKNGENGRISEVGHTTGWSTYLGNIMFESADDEPYIGVRSASVDLKSYSPVQWIKIERAQASVLPEFQNNPYCSTEVNKFAEGYQIACQQRYVELFTTEGADQNINYSASAPQPDSTQYVDASIDHVMKVTQGQTITLKFKAYNTGSLSKKDGLRYCFAKGYIDLDRSDSFEPNTDELLFDLGEARTETATFETTGYEKTFTIPADAAIGTSRLRIVFSDAWFPHPGPCGYTSKGFSIDFGVEISGTNTPRQPAPDFHDQGIADEPDRIHDADPSVPTNIENQATNYAGFSSFITDAETNNIYFTDVEKAWIYTTSGQLVKFVSGNPESLNVQELINGVYVVKMEYNNVIRNQKLYKK